MKKFLSIILLIAVLSTVSLESKAYASKDQVPELVRAHSLTIKHLDN